ncbi:MAG: HD domain-containing protein [Candidatus Pacebacteria bacterium]|nr:HD domain-containing protein [Candidatus Paceibacterota bacterium]
MKKRSLQRKIEAYDQGLIPLEISRGREFKENSNFSNLSEWDRDLYKISNSWAMRRISLKMQVRSRNNGFGGPVNPHVSNRRTHIDLTIIISGIIARELGLNVRLCEAIAAGHDLGHTPFGHNGERFLELDHALNALIILHLVERNGKGLNLTWEVLSGILNHSRNNEELYLEKDQPNEVSVVVLADKLAYLFLDIEELVICKPDWVDFESISKIADRLGKTRTERTYACINALIKESRKEGRISFSEREAQIFRILRDRMYREYYKVLDFREERLYQVENLKIVLEFFKSENLCGNLASEFVVGMLVDEEVDSLAEVLRAGKPTEDDFKWIYQLSAVEIVRSLDGKEIDHKVSPLWKLGSVA